MNADQIKLALEILQEKKIRNDGKFSEAKTVLSEIVGSLPPQELQKICQEKSEAFLREIRTKREGMNPNPEMLLKETRQLSPRIATQKDLLQ